MKVTLKSRWSITQTGDREIEVSIPFSPGSSPVLNSGFIEDHQLTDAEQAKATMAVIKAVAFYQD